jgi:hypothetical protein
MGNYQSQNVEFEIIGCCAIHYKYIFLMFYLNPFFKSGSKLNLNVYCRITQN